MPVACIVQFEWMDALLAMRIGDVVDFKKEPLFCLLLDASNSKGVAVWHCSSSHLLSGIIVAGTSPPVHQKCLQECSPLCFFESLNKAFTV